MKRSVPRTMDRVGPPISIFPLCNTRSANEKKNKEKKKERKNITRTGRNHELVSLGPDPQESYLVLHKNISFSLHAIEWRDRLTPSFCSPLISSNPA